jgi:hypothetical protein
LDNVLGLTVINGFLTELLKGWDSLNLMIIALCCVAQSEIMIYFDYFFTKIDLIRATSPLCEGVASLLQVHALTFW